MNENHLKAAQMHIMQRRRNEEPDDTIPISDDYLLALMYIQWADEWIEHELTDEQKRSKRSQ